MPVPHELRDDDRAPHVAVPGPPLGGPPGAARGAGEHGWLSPEAMVQVAAVMRVTPAYLESVASFYDMLELSPSAATRSTSARTSPARCAARTTCSPRSPRRPARRSNGSSPDGEFHLRSFECLGACDIAPMASIDGHYRGPLTPRDAQHDRRAPARGRCRRDVLPGEATRATTRGGSAREPDGADERHERRSILFKHFDVPGLRRIDVYERLGGYRGAAQGAHRDDRRPGAEGARGLAACAAAAARASRWARRRASCPTATSRSTSAATPTSRSRAPSRTAS